MSSEPPANGSAGKATAPPASSPAPASTAPAFAVPAPRAPSIPNLLSRVGPPRAGRGGRRGGRARMPVPGEYDSPPSYLYPAAMGMNRPGGRPAPPMHSASPATPTQKMATIQSTDTDAALSRLSAVNVGLLDDRFADYFAGDGGGPAPRRLPIINRGTYTRTKALDKIVESFLAGGGGDKTPRQIVSLGAGTDTRALRMLTSTRAAGSDKAPLYSNVVYHEIDFLRVSERKRAIVQAVPQIKTLLEGPVTQHSPTCWSVGLGDDNVLYSHGHDLRDLQEQSAITLHGFRADLPTLLVSECCLCYLLADEAVSVVRYFAQACSSIGAVIYEPIHPNDSFGRTMVSNLAARGIEMPTLAAVPDGPSQDARLTQQVGLDKADHRSIEQIWDTWVPEAEKARVNSMECLDEEEEWKLLASHYVVAWGHRGDFFTGVWDQLEAAPEADDE